MQLLVCCTVLLSFSIRCSHGYRQLEEKLGVNTDRNAFECLETLIGLRYWTVRDFLIIFNGTDILDDDFFQRFVNIRWELHSEKKSNLTGFSNTIFFTNNFDSFRATMSVINIRRIDSRAKFVISVAESFAALDEIKVASRGIPEMMWKLDKTHVLYLVPCNGDILAMTYFPFARNCQVSELEVLDIWRQKNFVKGGELFPEKMLNIRGCTQNHTVVFSPGSELQLRKEFTETGEMVLGGVGGRLTTIVAKRMNMKLHAIPQPLETWRLLADQVARGESLLSISGTIPLVGQEEILDIDSGYMEESIGFGYQIGDFEVSWKNIVWPLSREVWQYIGFTGLIFWGLLLLVNRYHHQQIISDKLKFLDCFGIFLGTARVLPQSYFGRYLFGMWIIYSYLINASYNSGLVCFLTTPKEKRVINTLKDLLADGMDFGGGPVHREFYHDPSDPVMMKIYENFKIWPESESGRLLMNRQGFTGIFSSHVSVYNSNQTGNASKHLRMLKDKAFTFQVPISMRRGSPFTFGVRRYASRAIEGGFHEYWLRYYTRKPNRAVVGSNTPTPISIGHLKGILYFHIMGLIFNCVIFLAEIIVYRHFQSRSSR